MVFDEGLRSPTTRRVLGVAGPADFAGALKATYQWRSVSGFIEDFIDDPTDSGKVTIVRTASISARSTRRSGETSDQPVRDYQAMIFQGHYRRAVVDGRRALDRAAAQQRNFEGEAANQPGNPSFIGDYPEVFGGNWDRQTPEGR